MPACTTSEKPWKVQRLCWWFALVPCLLNLHPGRAFLHDTLSPARNRNSGYATIPIVAMTGASQTTGSDSPAVTTGTSAVPNWRLIPKEADDYEAHLVDRPSWSENQYRESLELYEQLTSCSDSYVSPGIQSALETLDHAYRLYGPESVICSFNGGKDAVVILHLVRAVHAKYYNATGTTPIRPRAVYFNNHDEFSEVTAFLEDSVSTYDLDMVAFEHGVGFAAGLNILVEHNFGGGSTNTNTNTNRLTLPMAFVLGTRDSDPNAAGQDRFCPSSDWMPPFMRVNPVLEWNYGLVWHFLRLFKLPYCSLYDQGYTSLGTTKDTLPCPALVVHPEEVHNNNISSNNNNGDNTNNNNNNAGKAPGDAGSLPKFWPAYMLVDWDQERAGRVKKPKPGPKKTDKSSDSSSETRPTSAASSTDAAVDATNAKVTQAAAAADNSSNDNDNKNENENENGDDEKDASEYGGATKTVGMLVVGDEILKGMTTDTNTQTAARALRKECLTLSRVVVVSDDVAEIATEINRLRSSVDVVITSGGVGPTHDDVTIKGVAEALGSELVYNEDMGTLLKEKLNNNNNGDGNGNGNGNGDSESNNNKNKNNELTSAQLKMATLPPSAKLRYLSTDEWPVLQCRNIFVLPGVPEFFSKKIENVAAYLSSQLERSVVYKIVLSVDEPSIVDVLNRAVEKHSRVSIGSYPFVSHPEFKTVVTLEADLVDSSYMSSIANEVRYAPASALSSSSRNSLFLGRDVVLLSKEDRDRNARMALDELISELPEGSILRVENDDIMDPLM